MLLPLARGIGTLAASPRGRKAILVAVKFARSEEGRQMMQQARKVAASPEGRKLVDQAKRAAVRGGTAAAKQENRERLKAAARVLREHKR